MGSAFSWDFMGSAFLFLCQTLLQMEMLEINSDAELIFILIDRGFSYQ